MKFCSHCGKEIKEEAVVCPNCGCAVNGKGNITATDPNDASSFGYAFLGFIWPLVGLIMWLVWKDNKPLRAHSAGKGALIGFIVSIVVGIIYGAIVGAAIGGMMY